MSAALKRKRGEASSRSTGLAAGQPLKRSALVNGVTSSLWGWVGTEVRNVDEIASEHIRSTCGLSKRNTFTYCQNKYAPSTSTKREPPTPPRQSSNEDPEDIIIISDDDKPTCIPKVCKANPFCLNYLGQGIWEDEEDVQEKFIKLAKLTDDPLFDSKDPDLPVGLKNLGATCYANASLQVWFRDLAFRNGVYNCRATDEASESKFLESPIFQLQVTFAALQEGSQSVFNPTKLVESLKLSTTEQQDAQEFSKLFMSHLDAEFKKQSIPSVRSLVTDQFQGHQVYGTRCNACGYQSERGSDFLELEISFNRNATLEDCMTTLLQPETLSGDNKYLCPSCNTLQNATRYNEIKSLPPVLHFSVLRFVFDFETMERKKNKYTISFPQTLDMNKFVKKENKNSQDDIYELRGVLLHKGPSAYHGHYEAQVFDPESTTWFQFNDEVVTTLKTFGEESKKTIVIDLDTDVEDADKQEKHVGRKRIANGRKKRRIDDSDTEAVELPSPSKNQAISSKDAYMLIYAKKSQSCNGVSRENGDVISVQKIGPPQRAFDVIKDMNRVHDQACEEFTYVKRKAIEVLTDMRRNVMSIYQTWNITGSDNLDDVTVVDKGALAKWLDTCCLQRAVYNFTQLVQSDKDLQSCTTYVPPKSIDTGDTIYLPQDEVLCQHAKIDPAKQSSLKCITSKSTALILEYTGTSCEPQLSRDDVCRICVSEEFQERLYQIEHPTHVIQFDDADKQDTAEAAYWISKFWLKDWRLNKPKLHTPLQEDPGPGSPDYDRHVRCEHGDLSMNKNSRRRISVEACEVLTRLFPSWNPISSEAEQCAVCETNEHVTKGDRQEQRRRAEEEKATLKRVSDDALAQNLLLLEDVDLAILPSDFVRAWKQWLLRPNEVRRPEVIETDRYFCSHDLLHIDPNECTDLDSSIAIIKLSDWEILEKLYKTGPVIKIVKKMQDGVYRFVSDIPVCEGCRYKRKSDWEITEITIRRLPDKSDSVVAENQPQAVSTTSRIAGSRQSKRLREVKQQGEKRKISITKEMTLKDIKIQIDTVFSIPTICQRLFFRGVELEDNSLTVAALNVFANDVFDLQQAEEADEMSDSELAPRKKRREEGPAFNGTLLGASSPSPSSPPSEYRDAKTCPECTFDNKLDARSCFMCAKALKC